jgi:hypothetical protein
MCPIRPIRPTAATSILAAAIAPRFALKKSPSCGTWALSQSPAMLPAIMPKSFCDFVFTAGTVKIVNIVT